MILGASLPLSILLQVLVPIGAALVEAPTRGIICTASLHGTRAEPCGLFRLVSEWIMHLPLMNLFTLGLPTLLAYVPSVAILVIGLVARDAWRRWSS